MSETPITSDAVIEFERQYRMQWEPAQNSFVLLYPEGMIKLSGSAGEILKRVDGTKSAAAITQDLETSFPGVDLRQDVLDFLEVAYGKGWIRPKKG
ncbi:MAG: pyrroloquinoline quinone biosynthesis peptide chaperone PqqD [Betaproteobacteria bacterium]